MNKSAIALLAALVTGSGTLFAQQPPVPPVPANPAPAASSPAAAGAQAAPSMGEQEDGYWLKDASLNEVLQFLAKKAGKQYFHNSAVEGPAFKVTGHLNTGDPEKQMEELAFMYGIELYRKGDTIYALNSTQINQLPQEDFAYQLRYLRPTDIEQIKTLIQPMLSPTTGIVNFEPKTNTLLVIDSAKRLTAVKDLLAKLDQPKGQVIVETKILRVNTSVGSKIGVDWTSVLGDGLSFDATQSLNALFNLPELNTAARVITNSSIGAFADGPPPAGRSYPFSVTPAAAPGTTLSGTTTGTATSSSTVETFNRARIQGSGLVLSPLEVSAVLRALNTGNLASQKSNPTVITEDNEQASVSVIDRVPIITATSNLQNGVTQVTEEVRYRIDEADSTEPDQTREIGVTVSVTPTVLPDNTVRMKLRPRTAQIVEFIEGVPQPGMSRGNQYPRVAEATIDTIARVPNGYSLLIGGFYNEERKDGDTKVPILGDIPFLNFFFRSKENSQQQTSLVFIITPTSYDPVGAVETLNVTDQLMDRLDLRANHDSINPNAPGPAHKANLRRTMKGILFDALGPREGAEEVQEEDLPELPAYESLPPVQAPAPKSAKSPLPPPAPGLRGPKVTPPPPVSQAPPPAATASPVPPPPAATVAPAMAAASSPPNPESKEKPAPAPRPVATPLFR